jgi:hypothetical protein
MNETIAVLIGFLLTLLIYSYLIGDNPLYRLAVHLLVGVSAAYAAVIAVEEVFWPLAQQLSAAPTAPENLIWLAPLVFALLLLLSWIRPVAWVSNSSVGALVGVGAAVALVGAITGTLVPQAIGGGDDPVMSAIVAILTVLALLYFQFTVRADADGLPVLPAWRRLLAAAGRVVLTIALAGLFAGLLTTSLALLVERVRFFFSWALELAGGSLP